MFNVVLFEGPESDIIDGFHLQGWQSSHNSTFFNEVLKIGALLQVLEETGFKVSPEDFKQITSYNSSVGISGSLHHMFTCDIDDSMRADGGGGLV